MLALESSLRLSELALESGQLGSWSLDVATQRAVRSLRHDQIFGYPELTPEWTYQRFLDHVDPLDRAHVDTAYREALEAGRDWEFEARIIRVDGEVRWIWAKGKHFRDASGKPVEIVGLVADITERKRDEAALRHSEKLAAVGRLASTIAHEINNPLEAITNLLYLARTSQDLAEVECYLVAAEAELQRVSAITSQTLSFQRAVAVAKQVRPQDLIAGAKLIFNGRLRVHEIILEERCRTEASMLCFEGEIHQVINNLISNAIDAMPRGGRLRVRCRAQKCYGTDVDGVTITVSDTGSGMSPAIAKKIYDPFFSTKGSSGSGLGLWVSLEIVRRHHGRLTMRSSRQPAKHGTVFRLTLPCHMAPEERADLNFARV